MGFLARLRGSGGSRSQDAASTEAASGENARAAADDRLPDDELERERALLRAEAERLDDALIQRQIRYADRSWTPPRQGGDARAGDESQTSD
jgi:hypothetical protein